MPLSSLSAIRCMRSMSRPQMDDPRPNSESSAYGRLSREFDNRKMNQNVLARRTTSSSSLHLKSGMIGPNSVHAESEVSKTYLLRAITATRTFFSDDPRLVRRVVNDYQRNVVTSPRLGDLALKSDLVPLVLAIRNQPAAERTSASAPTLWPGHRWVG